MVTCLAGGTGTPKLLRGVPADGDVTVIANTGDDVELGGLMVCPDLDTVLYLGGDVLDTETWWGIDGDTTETHDRLQSLATAAGFDPGPRYLPDAAQTAGRDLARWRRISGIAEFMEIGDRDRAVHVTRTSLLDEGYSLTAVTARLAATYGLEWQLLPMSDDPVATIVHTAEGPMHFQEYWVAHRGAPVVDGVEFRGADLAAASDAVFEALAEPVVIGPSNPVTSLGPMLALDGVAEALAATPTVVVSPFVEDRVFSGPAAELMAGTGRDPSTAGVASMYPFADAFVIDTDDSTALDRPIVQTDTRLDTAADAGRVWAACERALAEVYA